jgi:hypothetical protein
MSIEARVHSEIVYHDKGTATFSIGSVTDHQYLQPTSASVTTAVATTAAVNIAGSGSLTTLGVKNTGSNPIRIGGVLPITPGRLAILPVTATVTVQTTAGVSSYTAVWIG